MPMFKFTPQPLNTVNRDNTPSSKASRRFPHSAAEYSEDAVIHLRFSSDLIDDEDVLVPRNSLSDNNNNNRDTKNMLQFPKFSWFILISFFLVLQIIIIVWFVLPGENYYSQTAPISAFKSQQAESTSSKLVIQNTLVENNVTLLTDSVVPLYWLIPASGSNVMQEVLPCFYQEFIDFNPFLNTVVGDSKIREHSSPTDAVIFSSLIYDTCSMLSYSNRRARLFTILRHPVDRIISMQEGVKSSKEKSWIQLSQSNYMIRMLTNTQVQTDLTQGHLDMAKQILEHYCIIGLYSDLRTSLAKFDSYFHWLDNENSTVRDSYMECQKQVIDKAIRNSTISISSNGNMNIPIRKEIRDQNLWDIQLYEFAQEIFHRQPKKKY